MVEKKTFIVEFNSFLWLDSVLKVFLFYLYTFTRILISKTDFLPVDAVNFAKRVVDLLLSCDVITQKSSFVVRLACLSLSATAQTN